MRIRLATRGSALALWQARRVSDLIAQASPGTTVELVVISTTADRNQERPLREFGDKALFVKEIEDALLDGRADAAIHSLKDVPGALPDGLVLAATPERADPRDALVSRHPGGLAGLPAGAVVATSSLRRRGQLLRLRADLRTEDIRGNVDTRLRKVREGQYDAMILAAAGLHRLGLDGEIAEFFSCEQMVPAPTQGILGIETPAGSPYAEIWRALDDPDVRAAADAERAFVLAIGADCKTAAGCRVSPSAEDSGRMRLSAMVCTPDGSRHLDVETTCSRADAVEAARRAASDILARGAREIIEASAAF